MAVLNSSPPKWKCLLYGATLGMRSVKRVVRNEWTELEFRRSWPDGGSKAEYSASGAL